MQVHEAGLQQHIHALHAAAAAQQQQQQQHAGGHGAPHPAAAVAAAAMAPRPDRRCAQSWTPMPGTNKIYLYGGMGEAGRFYNDLWCFDTQEQYWQQMVRHHHNEAPSLMTHLQEAAVEGDEAAAVPGARWGHTAVAYDGALYIFGGSMPGECFDEYACHANAAIDQTSTIISHRARTQQICTCFACTRLNSHLSQSLFSTVLFCYANCSYMYLFGGNTTDDSFNDLWRIELPACERWEQLEKWNSTAKPVPRIGHRAVAIGNRLIIYGGRTFKTNHFVKEASCYDTDKKAWLPANKSWSRAGSRRTGHSAVLWDRGMLIFGGLLEPNSNPSMDGLLLLDISGQPPKAGESLVAGPGSVNGR
eukprot:16158-Heterococcus_DN1.PRE.1